MSATSASSATDVAPAAQLRVAFVVGKFPATSEVFIINQIADLIDRGVHVEIFAFDRDAPNCLSARYGAYRMSELTHYLAPSTSKLRRLVDAVPMFARLLRYRPRAAAGVLNFFQHGRAATSLRLLFGVSAFVGREFDLVHCHFGENAVRYLPIRTILAATPPLVTSFYGYDVSSIFKNFPATYYDRLKQEASLFYVMSEDMRRRVLAHGFRSEKLSLLPVSINVDAHPFSERGVEPGSPVEILAVGRLVEKKGFDDLLRALALVRQRGARAFHCSIVGDGPLAADLKRQCDDLGLGRVVRFLGAMANDDLIALMTKTHLLVAPSKTASYGDME